MRNHHVVSRPANATALNTRAPPNFRKRLLVSAIALGLLALGPCVVMQAQAAPPTCTWNTGNGSWNDPGNWSGCNSTFPGTGSAVGGSASVANGADVTLDVGNLSVGALTINNSSVVDASGIVASNDSFTSVAIDGSSIFDVDFGAALTVTGGLTNSSNGAGDGGTVNVDANSGEGGGSLGIGGTLDNSYNGTLNIGNTGLSAATTVTAAALANNGTINLAGSVANQAALKIAGAAGFGTSGQVTGTVYLQGDTLLQFGSGSLTSNIGTLRLNGSDAQIQIGSDTTNNNALSGLALNEGKFILDNGASVTTTGDYNNFDGTTDVDAYAGEGGSSFNVGGTLKNNGTINIGNTGLSAAASVTAAALSDGAATINLYGSATQQASLKVAGAAGDNGTAGYLASGYSLQGDTLLQFGSGGLTTLTGGLDLNGNDAQVRIAGNNANNNALTGLTDIISGDLALENGASITTTVGLTNSGEINIDTNSGDGGSSLNVGGTLTNQANLNIGNGSLSAPTTVTAAAIHNTGTINLDGNTTTQASLKIAGAAGFGTAGEVTGNVDLQGDALLQFGSGSLTSNYGSLSLNGSSAQMWIGSDTANNNALTGLATNVGTFDLENGAAVSTSGGLTNSNASNTNLAGNLYVDNDSGAGGSSLAVGGTLTNTNTVTIGNGTLSAATTVTAQAVDNTGTINLRGNTATNAALEIAGAAGFGTAGEVTGTVYLKGDTLLQFGSGSLTSIASGGQLQLDGSNALVQDADNSIGNNALAGLATNAGTFDLENGAAVTTTTGFNTSGTLYVDADYQDGGSNLAIGGMLTNSGTAYIGNDGLSASTTVTAQALDNTSTGNLTIQGSTYVGGRLATLTVNGAASNAGSVIIGDGSYTSASTSNLDVTGGNAYIQTGGNTTVNVNGNLSAANVLVNGGVLQGDGIVTGNVVNSANVTGGLTIGRTGTLTIDGNFQNMGSGTVASYLSPGTGNNTTVITIASGSPLLQGGTIQGNAANGLTYNAGQTFTVMNFTPGSLTGVFGGVQNGSGTVTPGTSTNLGNGLTMGVVYNDHAGNIQLVVVDTPSNTGEIWNGGTGNWATASGWSSGAVPQFYSDVTIGKTGSGDVTLAQDATIQSLAINAGNTLQYQATTPETLSVGGDAFVNTGGALSLPTSGDKLAVGGSFGNTGTTTLGNGASLYTLGTFTNAAGATTSVGNGGSITALSAAVNVAGGTITLAGGSITTPTVDNGGTISGFGTVNAPVSNTGLVNAQGGTLVAMNGVLGTSGDIIVNSGATLDLSHSAGSNSTGTLTLTGALNLGGNNLSVATDYANTYFGTGNSFNKRANVTGTGQILATGNVAQAVSGPDVTGGTSATPTLAFGNVHVGTATDANYAIENTGTVGPSLRGAIQTSVNGGNINDASLSGNGVTASNWGPIAPGSSSLYTVTYSPTTTGALSGQTVHIANNFGNVGEQTLSITGAAYAYASPTVSSSLATPFNFGVVQAGQTYNDQLTISNTLMASNPAYQEGLNAAFGLISNSQLTASGSLTNLAAGHSNTGAMVVTLNPTSAGAIGGTVTIDFASNGNGTSGLGITNLNSQSPMYTWKFSGTVVNQASPSITPSPINLGNVRIGTAANQALNVENVATAAPQASLDAQISGATGAATLVNATPINHLAPGHADNTSFVVGLNTATAGSQSGAVNIALQSDSTPNGCTSNCIVNLPGDTVSVSGNVYRLANPTLNTSSISLAARVGDTAPTASVSVTNTSPDAYTEGLAASLGSAPAGFTSSGSISNLAAQGTDASSLKVGLNTATAGSYSGNVAANFISNGLIDNAAPISVGSQNVALTGNVYTPAQATVNTASPVNFGIVHVGDGGGSLSQNISVTNSAAVTTLNDTLLGSVAASGAPFSGSGTLGAAGLAAQQSSSALGINLSTANAGIYSGTANLSFASHDNQLADLALAGQSLGVSAQVNNYAKLAFSFGSGLGSLSYNPSNQTWTLDLGKVIQNSNGGTTSTMLAFLNDNPIAQQAFTDLLSSNGTVQSGSGFTLTGDSVADLAGGDSQSGFDIGMSTLTQGIFNEALSFNVNSSNSSGYDMDIGTEYLDLEGSVGPQTAVPEPGNLAMLLLGLGVLGFLSRMGLRRKNVAGDADGQ